MTAVDRLRIKTFGNLAITLGEAGVPNFASRKVEALLIYLACNPRSHRREVLANLLWDDRSQQQSMANLRVVLSSLRKEVGSYVTITRTVAAIDSGAALWLDAAALEAAVGSVQANGSHSHPASVPVLEEALALYDGDFLAGYFLPQAASFEDWAAAERARLHRLAITGLQWLGRWHVEQGAYQPAIRWATQLVAVDALSESGYRQLMGALALSGRRTEALRQYEACRQLLQDELGIFPSAETESLYEAIRAGDMQHAADLLAPAATPQIVASSRRSSIALPAFLRDRTTIERESPLFIGRELELARLRDELKLALQGNGRLLFVTGDAGSGKSSLMRSFSREASAMRQDALIAWGACSAFAGQGDPYLPFRDLLATLTGDIEVGLATDTLTSHQAAMLWQAMPAAVATLLDKGPDLLNTFIPGAALLSRLAAALPATDGLLQQLRRQLSTGHVVPGAFQQPQLFEQVAVFLRSLSEQQPILLFLDDLQWGDQASLGLLFHLSRRLAGSRLLLVGAYRAEEVALDRAGERHPLGKVIAESQRTLGKVIVDLEEVDAERSRAFVDALLDSEPNALGQSFRDELHARTGGHPLFTVETLRYLQVRGDLIQDEWGVWATAPGLVWDGLPHRVEGTIGERIARLDNALREILTVAAVEGEEFTAQVVAQLQALPERELLPLLSRELGKRHRLVREGKSMQLEDRLLSRFRFGHAVIQQYLYAELGAAERRLLHGQVGQVLEDLYINHDDDLVVRLARHFDEARNSPKAVKYLLAAGDKARSLFAHAEAVQHYERALEHLRFLKDDERLARIWMRLGLTYHNAFDYARSLEAYNRGFEYWQRVSSPFRQQSGEVTLRLWQVEPISLDPVVPIDDDTTYWRSQLFCSLVRLNAEKVIVPDLARKWEIRDDGRTYIFHLREDLRWSDGKTLTAHDFILAWKQMLAPAPTDSNALRLFDIKGARSFHEGQLTDENLLGLDAPDDMTLIIELERPTSYFLHLLAVLFPRPRHAVEAFGSAWAQPQHIVTNGPYKILDWSDNGQVLLGRNPYYHGAFSGNVSRVEVSLLKPGVGWAEGMDQYVHGQIDFLDVTWFPRNTVRAAQRRFGEFFTTLQPSPTTFGIHFNDLPATLGDARLRRALALAIDQEQLVSDLQKDNAIPALGGYIPPGLPGHQPDIGIPFDLQAAQRLLAEAGYPDGNGFPALEIAWFDLPDMRETAEYISQVWFERLGIIIQPVYHSLSELVAMFAAGTAPAISGGGWSADYHDPDCFLRVGMRSPLRHHRPIQDKIEAARSMTRQDQRLALYREVDKVIVEDAIAIPLHYSWLTAFFGPRVRKLSSNLRWCEFILDPD